jgi:ubiquinol-cytochrome c reductase cytochrome c subunit
MKIFRCCVSLVLAVMIAGSLAMAAQNPAPASAPRGNAENGRMLFAKFGCYECHGREAQGSTATGPRLGPNPIAYTRFISYIRKPTGEMPPYTAKVVTEQQAGDIYAFLQSLPRPPAAENIPLLK